MTRVRRPMIRRPGLTLVEAVLSLVIVGTAGLAVLSVIGVAARTDTMARERQIAHALAEDMLAELLAVPVVREATPSGSTYSLLGIRIGGSSGTPVLPDEISPDALDDAVASLVSGSAPPNTGRLRFGAVADYHGWSANPPQHRDGTPMQGFDATWRRAVYVEAINPISLGSTGVPNPATTYQVHVVVLRGERMLAHVATLRSQAWDLAAVTEIDP